MNAVSIPWDDQDEAQRARTLAKAKRARRHPHPAYAMLVKAAKGVITSFESDLFVHDRELLAKAASFARKPFLWAVGATGTTLAWLDHEASRWSAVDFVGWLESNRPEMFWWDGLALTRVNADEAVELLIGGST